VATAKILLLVNYRPEYRHEWGSKTYYTQLHLDPLGRAEAEEMLTILLGDVGAHGQWKSQAEAAPLRQFILEKTQGNPFFMEEIVQALREQGVLARLDAVGATGQSPLPTGLHLPPTVQGILAARIDRLPAAEKDLLQTLAVIGKEFSLGLLKQVVNKPEDELQPLLFHLQAAEFIYEQPAFPEVEYTFKHALTQEVAYTSLLQERRKLLHERTARAIEALFHSRLEDHYGDLAYHYSRSGNTQKAVEYLHLAGQQAVRRSANTEAISHLTAALELLQTLPDTPERAQQELTLHITLGPVLMATKGWTAPEVEQAYSRARELCRQVGETSQLFPVLVGLRFFYTLRGKFQPARELAEQLLALAQRGQEPALLLEAHYASGVPLVWLGEFVQAREHLEQGIALYNPQQHRSLAFLYILDPGVGCLTYAAWALWSLGYPDQALQRIHAALTLAQELSHPHSLAYALAFGAAWIHQFRREGQAVQERAEAAMALAREQGFPYWLAYGTTLRGWALAEQGQREEGIAQMRQGLAALQALGTELARSLFLALLAEAYGRMEQPEEGLTLLAEALVVVDKNGERYYEAELYRLKGQLTLQKFQVSGFKFQVPESPESEVRSPESEAEECFWEAIEIARRQQAKSLELRAVMSLSRLWQSQGKKKEAHDLLAEIYGWFTEGFDMADLKEAKALLEQLKE
jgi:predicted ATPase